MYLQLTQAIFKGESNIIKKAKKKRILGECLLISSLPGKASRMLVDIARLAERFNMHSRSLAW